jgi:hypothetical protein
VPQDAGQPEALRAWSGATACEERRVCSPDWGPKTGDANEDEGEGGMAVGESNVVDSRRRSEIASVNYGGQVWDGLWGT